MRQEEIQNIRSWFQQHQDEMVASIKRLVLIESPSDQPDSQQPVIAALTELFTELDYKTVWLRGHSSGGHLYARPLQKRQGQAYQLMVGHCDTVWPVGTLKEMPVEIEDDMMRGPGVYDMKAGLVMMIYAVKLLKELHIEPTVTPVAFINSDEEIGSRESTRWIRFLARSADRALVLEPSMGLSGQIKTARKGVGRFTVTVKGKAAHAGLDPQAGASAILELSHVIQQLFELNDYDKGITVNVGMIDGGIRANVVAPESTAVVDVRVLHQEDADYIENRILNLKPTVPGVELQVTGRIGRPPMEHTPANRILWQIMHDLAAELDVELEENTAGGGSDGNTTSLYTATLDGLGAVGDGAHAKHEFACIDKLVERSTLLALLLMTPPLSDAESGTNNTEVFR